MPTKLPEDIKSAVIQQWLQGKARDLIALDTGLSTGAVTNIINEWRRGLSHPLADDLRELAVTFKKIGITATQCAVGFRLAMIMTKFGVNEKEFEDFISDIYNNSKKLDLQPDKIAYYLDELLKFSRDIPLSQIPDYIKQKTNEKNKLENDIKDLQEKIKQLKEEKIAAEELYNTTLENERMTSSTLTWYSNLKIELSKYGIPVEGVSLFANAVRGLRHYGYDANKIIAESSDLDFLKRQFQFYGGIIPALEKKYVKLSGDCVSLEETVNSYRQRLSVYDELEQMGFGLKELKLLWHTINEIAEANNNISSEDAVQIFFKDVEEQYDDKLGFESILDKLRSDAVYFNQELDSLRSRLSTQPLVGPALQRLFENGIKEQDIIELAIVFGLYSSSDSGGGRGGNNPIDKQTLINELAKYGSVIAMIHALEQRNDELEKEVASQEAKKNQLNSLNHRMLSSLASSKQITYYFKGIVDSLRDEIVMRYVILAYVNYMLNQQFQLIPKLDDALSGEFAPILRAAKLETDSRFHYEKRNNNSRHNDDDDADDVIDSSSSSSSINELKVAVARAISLMINNLKYRNNSDDILLIEILDNARLALEK